jgi:Spy/CpxP family protein refolding chaperone
MLEREDDNTRSGWLKKTNTKAAAIATVAALAIGSAFAAQAFADSKGYAHMKQIGAGEYGGRWGHGHRGRFADMSDSEIQARIERMVKHIAVEIDATPEQTGKITVLLTSLAKDIKPLREDMHSAGQQIRDLLAADTIDRAALEKVRSERLAEADRVSKNLIGTAADVAEVLTPEQRKKLSERIEEFRGMRGRWHRG